MGFGEYAGDEVPPEDVNPILHAMQTANPKIILDNGKVVWGCECWWGSEEEIKALIATIPNHIDVDIEDARKGVI